jgi:hypothetical protein
MDTAESVLMGVCDSCSRFAELHRLPGREDSNCRECDSDIFTMIVLYDALKDAAWSGTDASEIENEVTEILTRYSQRCGLDCF